MKRLLAVLAFTVAATFAARAADLAAEARAERPGLLTQFPDAFAPVTDDPTLPRVLLIGDSISIGYTPTVRELLRGVANVHRIPDNGGPTTRGLALLDEWLGTGKWDVIHFNFGLHDLARPNGTDLRVAPADYEKNLRAIVARLKATGAKLVFATTTPVPNAKVGSGRKNADVLVCNAIVQKIMPALGIPLDDLYAVAAPQLEKIQLPANVHYTPEGYRVLAAPVAASIRAHLPHSPR